MLCALWTWTVIPAHLKAAGSSDRVMMGQNPPGLSGTLVWRNIWVSVQRKQTGFFVPGSLRHVEFSIQPLVVESVPVL